MNQNFVQFCIYPIPLVAFSKIENTKLKGDCRRFGSLRSKALYTYKMYTKLRRSFQIETYDWGRAYSDNMLRTSTI